MPKIRFHLSAMLRTAVTAGAFLALCCGNSFADRMASDIQEAIYNFEMKGNVNEAVRILEKVSKQGDKDDQREANFFLGKIYELSSSKNSAHYYYKQSLRKTKETGKAYWLAARAASTSDAPEALLKNSLRVRFPIKKIYYGPTTHILLQNNSIYKIENDTLVELKIPLPVHAQILDINSQGIWYQRAERDSIFFKPIHPKTPQTAFKAEGTKKLFTHNSEAVAMGAHSLTILNKKGVRAEITERYNNCKIEGFYGTTGHYVLNCPDNALHFITPTDGSETYSISLFDAIPHVLIIRKNIFLVSGNTLFCYQPKIQFSPLWKLQFNNIDEVCAFENNIAVLEASGKVTLIDEVHGLQKSTLRSDATSIAPLSQGTLGLFSNEGALSVVDTLLRPLWHFNFSKPILYDPIHTDGNIFLVFDDYNLQGIAPNYYGFRPLLSDQYVYKAASLTEEKQWNELAPTLDTLFELEPGNAEGWFFKALLLESNKGSEKERQEAWAEAVRLSASNPQVTNLILNHYSKAINAKFVSLLNISPKTRYPRFFGNKKNLYTIDPAAERLLCINPESGEVRWTKPLNKMDNSPVMSSDENTLALASGFNLSIYDLNKDAAFTKLQLPGKAFDIKIESDAIYVSTWNGFLLKYLRNDNRLAWSRKIYSVPFLFARSGNKIHLSSLEGEVIRLGDGSGQAKENGPRLQGSVTHLTASDSSLIIATGNNRLHIYSLKNPRKDPIQILLESPISSLQSIKYQGENMLVLGLSNQNILLYNESGTPLWKYQGHSSIFTQPIVNDDIAWIDQGNEVVGISLKDGTEKRTFSTPGGAGSPYITNHTLFSASPKRILYGFTL
ncbi:MAG: hypothetical protein J6U20_03395 [Fibrobacter sp.]|nr:hypothetical protein [Fibrobacter sp.]